MKILKSKNIKIFLNYILGPLLFVWLSWSIFKQIRNQPNLSESWMTIMASFSGPLILNLVLVVLLMLVNWSLEAIKWKISVIQVQPVSFLKSLRAVFSGVSFSVTTPNRMGEYIGRVLYMKEGNRIRVISLTVLCSFSQLIVTIFFGLLALLMLKEDIIKAGISGWPAWINIILSGGILVMIFLTVFYFRISWIIQWLDKLPGIKKIAWLINELEKANATLLFRLLSLSALRYLVFAIQYFLLFQFFGVEVSWWQGFWSIALVFFIMAAIPNIALFEVVQKVYVTKEIFAIFTINTLGLGFVTTTIWFINLVVPAAIGSLLIIGIKIFKKENEAT